MARTARPEAVKARADLTIDSAARWAAESSTSRMVMVSEPVLAASAISVCELTLKSSAVVPRCLFCSRLRMSS